MTGTAISFASADIRLEGRLHLPQYSAGRVPGVVLCHPHPLYGGNMGNNIVLAVSRALNAAGIAALRFNFRGVGSSGGCFDHGEGEQDDARAALAALAERPEVDAGRLGIAGYSFGGMVALSEGIQNERVQALAAISPVLIPGVLQGVAKPVYCICGTKDHVVSPEALLREVEGMALPGKVEVVQGSDHFWGGSEATVARSVAGFFLQTLKAGP